MITILVLTKVARRNIPSFMDGRIAVLNIDDMLVNGENSHCC